MALARAALVAAAVAALAALLVSGGSEAGPRTPPALPGLPPPFLGTAVSGDGGLTAAVDAYGDVVDLRAPGPAGRALIENPAARQQAGTVAADTGIVPRLRVGGGPALPLWRGEAVRQRYLPGTNVVETVGVLEGARVVVRTAAAGEWLAMEVVPGSGGEGRAVAAVSVSVSVDVRDGIDCARAVRAGVLDLLCRVGRALPPGVRRDSRELFRESDRGVRGAVAGGRGWVRRARGLGAGAPGWARAMYRRSLLVLRALTDRRTGAVAAGARDGWAYVWPRDAATAVLAYAAAGYRGEARQVAGFLRRLATGGARAAGSGGDNAALGSRLEPEPGSGGVADVARIEQAARFDGDGTPVAGRGPQGDAHGWIAVTTGAGAAAGRSAQSRSAPPANPGALESPIEARESNWRDLPDYQEGSAGTYLGNAIAAGVPAAKIAAEFGTPRGLVRGAGDPSSGLDSAAAWAVRPFPSPDLYPAVRRTLLNLAADATPYGVTPGEGWHGGVDPWTAATAWSAWSLA
ncbi:MAG TPA: hypothetical protein VEB65_05375, partial [Solirubrobacterales bacterium]|nr:hypothetical protein [Solirubrobacterales bacterium]